MEMRALLHVNPISVASMVLYVMFFVAGPGLPVFTLTQSLFVFTPACGFHDACKLMYTMFTALTMPFGAAERFLYLAVSLREAFKSAVFAGTLIQHARSFVANWMM